ncbi:helicase-related protein [Nocardiopsis alba]|uniref:Helicase conserved C-terminal domain protein n=1 Tax=Nocardiopsis alba (strain ATCC BAA-2165 / BE74) TaxID=1205910 RepID=J7KXY5_NOCAA|nr:helicase-related protein [Nocardiopsis alba]AFR06253.1 helicase conserved C-terminal domain protein [Nocardiopsis alba ATCC BAA-2165]
MTRIFDNIDVDLGPHLLETFASADRMDSAVGYFNLRGWATFADTVDAKPEGEEPAMRVLVGMTLADPDDQVLASLQSELEGSADTDEVDREVAKARRQSAILKFRTQLMRGVPNNRDLKSLQRLRQHLIDGRVKIKLFTRRPLHGKTYLCHRQDPNTPIVGFVGSSNLTMSGLRHNYELNVDVLDFDAAKKLDEWFVARWEDKFSLDITKDLIEIIDESWAGGDDRSPYEVFLKVCYHLSQDVREGLIEYSLPASMREKLLEYQVNAVQTLARRIHHRGGTMLGDVVGLGKTLTGVATALMLREEHGYSTLVLCPKNLVKMWDEHLQAYDVPGRVVSYTTAHKDLPEMRAYQLIIVDESHTLRSDKRRDYAAIKDYIDNVGSKVLLLTATPYNIRFLDVANQLGLYIDDDDDLGLQPLSAMQKNPKLAESVDFKTNTMLAFRKSEEADDWKRLMSEHLVRRTRSFIRANYGKIDPENGREYLLYPDGSRFYFPERTPKPLDHSFGENDPAALMASDKTLSAIDGLILPRYNLSQYVDGKVAKTPTEADWFDKLERARGHLTGFVRTGLYKRLSSCGHSYVLSLQRHLTRNDMFLYALANDLPLPVGTVLDAMFNGAQEDTESDDEDCPTSADAKANYDALVKAKPKSITWIRADLFKKSLTTDIETDSVTIRDLLEDYGTWSPDVDSKMDRLVELVTQDHGDEKVLVFTEYKDTANYVAQALKDAGVDHVALVTGDTEDPTKVVRTFAPMSNRRPNDNGEVLPADAQHRVLIATDVLSEGQNLQDARVVVNYDLPWAIIRLIQRAGRVDRVGQQAEELLIYSFFHESVETVLSLRQRIKERLAANAEAFGSDERFFGSEEETKAIEDLYAGHLDDEEMDVEVDASSLAYEVWSRAEKETPELAHKVTQLPELIHATRSSVSDDDTRGIACYVRTENGSDGFGFATSGEDLRLLTGHEALKVFRAEPDTSAQPRREDHFDLTAALARGPLAKPSAIEGRLRGVRKRVWNRLNGNFVTLNSDVGDALEALFRRPLTREAERRLKSALTARSSDDDLGDLLVLLHRDNRLVVPDAAGSDPIRIVCTMGVSK